MIEGFHHTPRWLGWHDVDRLIAWAGDVRREAPLLKPRTRQGQEFRLAMTAAGEAGWWSDEQGGYRYVERHPTTGRPWPPIPEWAQEICIAALAGFDFEPWIPHTCLITWYAEDGALGKHRDQQEPTDDPIVNVSIGDDALFRVGTANEDDPLEDVWLSSGDLVVMAGPARHAFHQLARLRPNPLFSPLRARGRLLFSFRRLHA